METLKAYWRLSSTPLGIKVSLVLKGKLIEFPEVFPNHLGLQLAAIRDVLFALSPGAQFSLESWDDSAP